MGVSGDGMLFPPVTDGEQEQSTFPPHARMGTTLNDEQLQQETFVPPMHAWERRSSPGSAG